MKADSPEVKKALAAAITQAMWVKGIITTEEKAKIDTMNAQTIDNSKSKKNNRSSGG